MRMTLVVQAGIAAVLWWLSVFGIADSIKNWDYLIASNRGIFTFVVYCILFIILSIARHKLYKQTRYEKDNPKD